MSGGFLRTAPFKDRFEVADVEDGLCTLIQKNIGSYRCAEPAAYRMGYRCRNGCFGEGRFDRSCEDHRYIFEKYRTGEFRMECYRCHSTASVEFFPIQKL